MQGFPKITVITVNYNQGIFLEQTIKSVLDQNYPDLQYLIFDGLSTDNSVEIIKKHEKHLAFWVSEKDAGQTDAINKGLKMATGDIITWLNADDCFLPGSLLTAATVYNETKYDFFLGNSIFIDVDGNVLAEQHKSSLINGDTFIPCHPQCRVHQPSSFFSKNIISQTGLLDQTLHYAMDVDLWIKMAARKARMVYRDENLTLFRRHNDAKSAKGNLPFIEDTLKSSFFSIALKKVNPPYYKICKKWIYIAYFDNLLLEHHTKQLLRFSLKLFFSNPFYTVKKLTSYFMLKIRLKLRSLFSR